MWLLNLCQSWRIKYLSKSHVFSYAQISLIRITKKKTCPNFLIWLLNVQPNHTTGKNKTQRYRQREQKVHEAVSCWASKRALWSQYHQEKRQKSCANRRRTWRNVCTPNHWTSNIVTASRSQFSARHYSTVSGSILRNCAVDGQWRSWKFKYLKICN